jgi:PIN domain nuclease of toxin-antitoxin system
MRHIRTACRSSTAWTDTHVLLHAVAGELTAKKKRLLGSQRWSMSAIVLWEIARLAQLGRIELDPDDPVVVRALAAVHVWPITPEIAKTSTRLDVRSDPADELIAATSIVHHVPLLTRAAPAAIADRPVRLTRPLVFEPKRPRTASAATVPEFGDDGADGGT